MNKDFVNRHGNRSPLQNIEPSEMQDKTPEQDRRNSFFQRIAASSHIKHRILFFSILTLLLVGISILVMLDSAKRAYERQDAAMIRNVLDVSKTMPSNNKSASETSKALKNALTADASCSRSGLNITNLYSPAKIAQQKCQKTAIAYKSLRETLNRMYENSLYTEKISNALKSALAPPSESQFASPGDYIAMWRDANDVISDIQAPKDMTAVHSEVTARVSAIHKAWESLDKANRDKNESAFSDAETALTKAYADMRAASTGIETVLEKNQAEILSRVDDLQK